MKAVLQRVTQAKVEIAGQVVGQIEQGILALICVEPQDTEVISDKLLQKILNLRIFEDQQGKMNLSLKDIQGGLLLVSQFTLVADLNKGTRPGFAGAAHPSKAQPMFEQLVAKAQQLYPVVQSGVFAANMQISLTNDGPVTIPLNIS